MTDLTDSRYCSGTAAEVRRFEVVPLADVDRWCAALDGIKHSHAHCQAHAAAFQASTHDETFLCVGLDEDDRPLVVCPLAVRGEAGQHDVYTPYGFGGFASARPVIGFLDSWQRFAVSQGWVTTYALQNPLIHAPMFDGPDVRQNGDTFCLDLVQSEAELLARMSAGRRNELRRWGRRDAVLVHDMDTILSFVLEVADQFFAARHAAPVYQFAPQTWMQLLASPSVCGLGIEKDGHIVAAALFGESCGIVDYLFGLSIPGEQAETAPLIWNAVQLYKARSCSVMNLGGGVRDKDGVAEFKRRFGAFSLPIVTLRLVHRSDLYHALCERAGADVTSETGFFPAYRRAIG